MPDAAIEPSDPPATESTAAGKPSDSDASQSRPPKRANRRAAWIASAVALPVTVLLALALTNGRGSGTGNSSSTSVGAGPAAALSVAASSVPAAALTPCEKVSEKLPITLDTLSPRVVHGPPFVVAWGNPSVLYRCGVGRPAGLSANSGSDVIDTGPRAGRTVEWFPVKVGAATVWTSIDRAVYLQVTIPEQVQGGDVISTLSGYIAAALPAVCQAYPVPAPTNFTPALDKSLCVNRK